MSAAADRLSRASKAIARLAEYMSPSRDKAEIHELLRKFGSPGALVEAGKNRLMRSGLAENEALLLSLIPGIVRHNRRMALGKHPQVGTLVSALEYLSMVFVGFSVERFYMLEIDDSGRLIDCVMLQRGNENSAPFYMKQILAEVVRSRASYIVISHNHPGDTLNPSFDDIECTHSLISALSALDVPLLDHVIVAGKIGVSLRGLNIINREKWERQTLDDPINAGWLDGWKPSEALDSIKP